MTQRMETTRQLEAFEFWWGNDQDFRKTSQKFAINLRTLYDWADRFEWGERAAQRRAQAQGVADKKAIDRLAAMLERHGKIGRSLQSEVTQFLINNKGQVIQSAQDAARLAKLGIEIERTAEGLPAWVLDIMNMDNNELLQAYSQISQESD